MFLRITFTECKDPAVAVNMVLNMNWKTVGTVRVEETKCCLALPRPVAAASPRPPRYV